MLPEVQPAGEEPPPPDGNPHPQFGPELTAEQLYQQQVHNWLVQNAAPAEPDEAVDNGNNGGDNAAWGAWPQPPAPPLPPIPPHLVNYQAWLAAQGLAVQDGILPENNLTDSPTQAWNDSFSTSDEDSSSTTTDMIFLPQQTPQPHNPSMPTESFVVSVVLHKHGIQFGLSTQGSALLSLLIEDPIPRQRLNTFIFDALRPMIAIIGSWRNAFGMRTVNAAVSVLVSSDHNGIHFEQLPSSSVIIQELQPDDSGSSVALPAPPAAQIESAVSEDETAPASDPHSAVSEALPVIQLMSSTDA